MDISNSHNEQEEEAKGKTISEEFNAIKRHIVEGAQELFWTYGLRSVTMDDIANKLAMSKKTVYQYIQDKAELVYLCAEYQLDHEHCNMEEASEQAKNAIDQVLKIMEYNRQFFLNFHPSLILDLQRSYPKAWKMFLRHKEEKIIKGIQANMERGINEGLYRPDIEPEVMARMRMAQVESIFNPQVFSPKTHVIGDVQFQVFKHFLYGLVTLEGHQILTEAITQIEFNK